MRNHAHAVIVPGDLQEIQATADASLETHAHVDPTANVATARTTQEVAPVNLAAAPVTHLQAPADVR